MQFPPSVEALRRQELWLSALNEFAVQTQSQERPILTHSHSDEPHAPVWTATLQWQGRSTSGQASTKKDAANVAARSMLTMLATAGSIEDRLSALEKRVAALEGEKLAALGSGSQ